MSTEPATREAPEWTQPGPAQPGLADALADDGGQQVDITGDIQAAAMPTRVVWGVQDRIIPWTQVSHAGSRVAVHLIQDAGHVPHWDQPAEVAALFG